MRPHHRQKPVEQGPHSHHTARGTAAAACLPVLVALVAPPVAGAAGGPGASGIGSLALAAAAAGLAVEAAVGAQRAGWMENLCNANACMDTSRGHLLSGGGDHWRARACVCDTVCVCVCVCATVCVCVYAYESVRQLRLKVDTNGPRATSDDLGDSAARTCEHSFGEVLVPHFGEAKKK